MGIRKNLAKHIVLNLEIRLILFLLLCLCDGLRFLLLP